MNSLVNTLIQRWRAKRSRNMLQTPYSGLYAFVGAGNHALQNLFPVLQYLGIRLKYICCKSSGKLPLIERRFGVTATTSLEAVLEDKEVKGVFVCTTPTSHYDITRQIIESGKYLFVEKPPCLTSAQLETLISEDLQQKVMVGMQKRDSPLIKTLKARLPKDGLISYTMLYRTGAYPEGNPVTDLFIHPVDLALHLFGKAEITAVQRIARNGAMTVQLLLSHAEVKGFIESSTAYSWSCPEETLSVNTLTGEYRLEQMERLYRYSHPKRLLGVPLEKAGIFTPARQILAARENFSPLITNNQLYTQGFISEIKAFADMVEQSGKNHSPLTSLSDTYKILAAISNYK